MRAASRRSPSWPALRCRCPDWSPAALGAQAEELRALRRELEAAGRVPDADVRTFPDDVDLALADATLAAVTLAGHPVRTRGSRFDSGADPQPWAVS